MTLVVDASVALKWFVDEPGSARAVDLLSSGEPMIAPELVLAEVCNAGWKSLRRREIDGAQLDEIATDLARAFARLVSLDQLILRAAAIAPRARPSSLRLPLSGAGRGRGRADVTAARRPVAAVQGTALAGRVNLLGQFAGR